MTQPSDPRKVKVILELIDHTRKIAELNERGDLAERLERVRPRTADDPAIAEIVGFIDDIKGRGGRGQRVALCMAREGGASVNEDDDA